MPTDDIDPAKPMDGLTVFSSEPMEGGEGGEFPSVNANAAANGGCRRLQDRQPRVVPTDFGQVEP